MGSTPKNTLTRGIILLAGSIALASASAFEVHDDVVLNKTIGVTFPGEQQVRHLEQGWRATVRRVGANKIFVKFYAHFTDKEFGIDTKYLTLDLGDDMSGAYHTTDYSIHNEGNWIRRRLGWKPSHDIPRRRPGFHHSFNRIIREKERESEREL